MRTEHVTAFVPYAAKWPAEVHVYPNRHVHNLAELTDAPLAPGDDAPAWPAMHGFRMRVWLAEPAHPGERGRAGGDHQRLEWVRLDPPDQLRRLPWLEADLPIIDALVDALRR